MVWLTVEDRRHQPALADNLSTDAVPVQHEPSARLGVVVARCVGSDIDRLDVRAIRDRSSFDRRPATPTQTRAGEPRWPSCRTTLLPGEPGGARYGLAVSHDVNATVPMAVLHTPPMFGP